MCWSLGLSTLDQPPTPRDALRYLPLKDGDQSLLNGLCNTTRLWTDRVEQHGVTHTWSEGIRVVQTSVVRPEGGGGGGPGAPERGEMEKKGVRVEGRWCGGVEGGEAQHRLTVAELKYRVKW